MDEALTTIEAQRQESADNVARAADAQNYWTLGGPEQQKSAAARALVHATLALVAEQRIANAIALANTPEGYLRNRRP